MQVALFLGSVFYAFEGIALVLPIENALSAAAASGKRCFRYEELIVVSMLFVVFLFACVGALCGLAFPHTGGSIVAYLALLYPSSSAMQLLNAAVAAAVLCTYPLQLAPAMPTLEAACCGSSSFAASAAVRSAGAALAALVATIPAVTAATVAPPPGGGCQDGRAKQRRAEALLGARCAPCAARRDAAGRPAGGKGVRHFQADLARAKHDGALRDVLRRQHQRDRPQRVRYRGPLRRRAARDDL
mmetsp:Transcript_20920/g.65469  ORF Transcript_20920/g.65469 Transcript_20920/m.65469 type:complete len:244 (-) Transcript_20920:1241-1972(-)